MVRPTELTVPEVLAWCVRGSPCGLLPETAVQAHRQAFALYQRSPSEGAWRVAEHALRALWNASTPTAQDVGVLLEYAFELSIEAWFECDGWTQQRVRDSFLRSVGLWMRHLSN